MAQTRARNDGRLDLVSRIIQKVTAPPASLISHAIDGTGAFFSGMTHAAALRHQVDKLSAQSQVVADYTEQVQRLENEIADLRKLQGFRDIGGKTAVPAEVTGIFINDNRITLNVGAAEGIKPSMPVLSGRGLLAIVQTVEGDHSQALLLSSPVTKIGAIASRNPPAAGLLSGEGAGVLKVEFLDPNAVVQVGDEVVTSGFSDQIPRGIPIGRVINVEKNEAYGSERAVVFPWASLGAAHDVYVMK